MQFEQRANTSESEFVNEPHFAAGECVGSLFLQRLVCQTFFNPHLIGIVTALLGGTMAAQPASGASTPSEYEESKTAPGAGHFERRSGVPYVASPKHHATPVPQPPPTPDTVVALLDVPRSLLVCRVWGWDCGARTKWLR